VAAVASAVSSALAAEQAAGGPAGATASSPAAGSIARIARPRAGYLPAPPRISIRPAPMSGPVVPDAARNIRRDVTPAAARRLGGPPVPQSALGDGSPAQSAPSPLAQSTAHLFQAARLADSPLRRSIDPSGGSTVSTPSDRTIRRAVSIDELAVTSQPPAQQPSSGVDLDEIVERVIDKIEQRVVDELERRGRFYNPGMF
jgi:hypothetical protein